MYNARIKAKELHRIAPQESLSFSLNRVIAGRAARMIAAIAGAVGLLYLVALVPGAIVLALPGGVAAAGKVYDEARLIQYLRYGNPINPGVWEKTDVSSEINRDISMQFSK